jgi:non-canonical poly(A) RNA polymerase PAPD5/7
MRTAANRPLFKLRHDEATDSSAASLNTETKSKFRNLDELTDSGEEDMVQSAEEDEGRHTIKRARLDQGDVGVAPASSKWSNPDPYTSLPPAGDVAAKRTDVVKLIRKARIDTDLDLPKAKQAADFISFDADEPVSNDGSAMSSIRPKSPSPQPAYVPPTPQTSAPSMVTGKRKRGPDNRGEGRYPLRSHNHPYADQRVEDKWMAPYGINAKPWLRTHSPTDLPGVA